jgi:uncharacterized protein YjbI with pentapeptide repeats
MLRALLLYAFILVATTAHADIYRWDNGELIPGTEGIEPGPSVDLSSFDGEWNTESKNLRFADFSGGLNLAGSNFIHSWLDNADLSGADLTGAYLYYSALANANLSGANLANATLNDATLTDTNLSGANLTNAALDSSTLTNADLSGAILTNAYLASSTLTNADLSGAELANAYLDGSTLTNTDLSGAILTNATLDSSTLTNADLSGAVVTRARLYGTTSRGFTQAQLASTASYEAGDLSGISLSENDLSGWDFHGQNLSTASLYNSTFTNADLSGANLTNASLFSSTLTNADLSWADTRGAQGLDLTDAIVRNTIRPDGTIAALELVGDARLVLRDDDGVPDPAPTWWLSPRPPIAITIAEQMSMSDEGGLQLFIESDPWDSLISFEPGIPVQLGGRLELAFAADVDVATQIGRAIRIYDWAGVEPTGVFTVSSLYPWDVSQLYTTGEVTLLLPGDTNGDQTVDLNDLNNVRNNFGGTRVGDTNGDQVIDLIDLNNVRNFFGASMPQAVPEPSSVVLAAAALVSIAALRRRRAS